MEEPIKKPRILLLGATGYIGGSVLTKLVDRNGDERYEISALVRKPYQASILTDAGVTPILFESLDDFEVIREAARSVDVVINCASARHEGCVKACIFGLSLRKAEKGTEVCYIHTAGTSMIADWPITGERVDGKVYSDVEDNIYEIEKNWPEEFGPVRKVNQMVVWLGVMEEVKTYIVAPPLIFGPGTGSFTLGVGQVHQITKLALKKKQSVMIGPGLGIWSRIHILDLSHLYALLLDAALESKPDLPTGQDGYYFAENGSQTWKSISERIGKSGKGLGAFETDEVGDVGLEEVAQEWTGGDIKDAESVLASNSRTKADKARQVLGWKPKYGEDVFWEEVDDVVAVMSEHH